MAIHEPVPRPRSVRAPAERPEVSVVMPCLNEAETLRTCLRKARASLEQLGVRGEIVVADNGSTDGCRAIAVEEGARLEPVAERGYGAALMGGIAAARGRYVIMGDADDSYDFAQLGPFVESLRAGNDLVMGNRFAGGIEKGAMPWLHRYVGNRLLTLIGRRWFGTPVGDVYCGLRGFRKEAIEGLELRATGMEFALEMVAKASLCGLRVAEVPTALRPDGRTRAPHLRTWRDGWRSLRFFLLYSPRWLFLYPGLALIALGVIGMAWLAAGAHRVGPVVLDVHTMLYCGLAVMIGFQSVTFSVFGRMFAVGEGLLPPDSRALRLFRPVRLEAGVAIGVVMLVLGIAGTVATILYWQSRSFDTLPYAKTMRIVIPSATLIACGCQVILASFFASILALKRRGTAT